VALSVKDSPMKDHTVSERIRFIVHQNKQVLLVDCSSCSARQIESIARTVPDVITAQPRSSVLVLVDFTGASFDQEAFRALKETLVFDKPYIKRSAWIGAAAFSQEFRQELVAFSRRELPDFGSRNEALAWLVAGD
jgi:hypothetical protein